MNIIALWLEFVIRYVTGENTRSGIRDFFTCHENDIVIHSNQLCYQGSFHMKNGNSIPAAMIA